MKIKTSRNDIFYRYFRQFVCGPVLHLLYDFKIEGRENLPSEGPAFILVKHQAWMDLFVICYISPIPLYYVAKHEIFENLFGDFKKGFLYQTGRLLKRIISTGLYWLGALPMNRNNPKDTLSSFKYMEKLLEKKEVIVFFPEGKFFPGIMGEIKPGLIKWMMKLQKKKEIIYPVINIGINYEKTSSRIKITCSTGTPEYYNHNDTEVLKKITENIKFLSNL